MAIDFEGVDGGIRAESVDDGAAQFCRDHFVGVDAKHPRLRRGGGAEILLVTVAGPGAVQNARAAVGGDLQCGVGGAGVDDDDFAAEIGGPQAAGKVGRFIRA